MINIKILLAATFIAMFGVYFVFLPENTIVDLIKDEYILFSVNLIAICILLYFKNKLKDLPIYQLVPNTHFVPIKSTVIFFLIFQVVDFYSEHGFIGMISQWITYWIFGVLAWLLTNNINYYKNYLFYKYESVR